MKSIREEMKVKSKEILTNYFTNKEIYVNIRILDSVFIKIFYAWVL